MTHDLTGQVAIVTGAGTGIGRAIALAFADAGMNVVLAGRRREPLEETAALIEGLSGDALVVPTDVTDKAQVDNLAARTLEAFGQIDVLYNNAGRFNAVGGLWEIDPDEWWQDVTINVRGPMLCAHAVLPHMIERNRGIVLNMSGGGAVGPMAGGSGYGTSKAAILRLTDSLARELMQIESNVRVYAVDPGFNPTDMTHTIAGKPATAKWLPGILRRLESGEGHDPSEAAQTSLDLIRRAPASLHGCVIYVGDDLDNMIANGDEIKERELRTLRLRVYTAR